MTILDLRLALRRRPLRVIDRPLVRIRSHGGNRSGDRVRVWADGARALERLAVQSQPYYSQDFCDGLAKWPGNLYRLGANDEARRVFASAYRLGRPQFPGESRLYRTLAAMCGPMTAEYAGGFFAGCCRRPFAGAFGVVRKSFEKPVIIANSLCFAK